MKKKKVVPRIYAPIAQVMVLLCVCMACKPGMNPEASALSEELLVILHSHVPDPRTTYASLEVDIKEGSDSLWILGETDVASLRERFLEALEGYSEKKIGVSIKLLPDSLALQGEVYAVANNSVSNMRSEPRHGAELTTQALLGMPLRVLKQTGTWFLVQTMDKYLGWMDEGGLKRMDAPAKAAWQQLPKLIVTAPRGYVYAYEDGIVSDLVMGNVLAQEGAPTKDFYPVLLPDGRKGKVNKADALPLSHWDAQTRLDASALIQLSLQLKGFPYLWGGTSVKGMDCSGFVKTLFLMQGWVIPRDASQQVLEGELVGTSLDEHNFMPGDLLFFGHKAYAELPERTVHVGLYLGDDAFIHASGRVRISSFDSASPQYDAYNVGRFLRAKRYIGTRSAGLRRLPIQAF